MAGTTGPAGNGQDFQLGRNFDAPAHVLARNPAWGNRSYEFDENGASGPMTPHIPFDTAGSLRRTPGCGTSCRTTSRCPGRNDIADEVDDRFNSWTLPYG